MLQKAEWEKGNNGNEWSFIGDGEGFQLEIAQRSINNYFTEEELYLVTDRNKSKEIKKENAASEVKSLLKDQDVTLCNKEFKRFIVFNHIGVAKQGEYHS